MPSTLCTCDFQSGRLSQSHVRCRAVIALYPERVYLKALTTVYGAGLTVPSTLDACGMQCMRSTAWMCYAPKASSSLPTSRTWCGSGPLQVRAKCSADPQDVELVICGHMGKSRPLSVVPCAHSCLGATHRLIIIHQRQVLHMLGPCMAKKGTTWSAAAVLQDLLLPAPQLMGKQPVLLPMKAKCYHVVLIFDLPQLGCLKQ